MRALVAALVALAAGALAAPPSVLDLRVARPDGTIAALREVAGSGPTLIAFWATYCAPCRAEVPALNRAAERWRVDGLRVLGVALETDAARVRETREAWGMRYDALPIADGQDALADALFPRGLPTSAFVASGTVTLHEHLLDDAAIDKLITPIRTPPRDTARGGGGPDGRDAGAARERGAAAGQAGPASKDRTRTPPP